MSAPAEVLAYFQTLAWPAVAVTGFIMFRKPIGSLIPQIKEISAAGASVKFGEVTAKLADKAGSLAEDVIEKAPGSPQLPSSPNIVDPTMLFLAAYGQLESSARDAAPTAGIKYPNPSPVQVIRRLAEKGLIPKATVSVADELRGIRNEVAHGARPLEPVDAQNLADTARSLALICIAAIPRSNSML
jgi:Domain of unknown function (DUF4145)